MRYAISVLLIAVTTLGASVWAYEDVIGRVYANKMADKPHTRFGITDDAQSHIVPTLIRQER
jgi:hypothetical protein